MLCNKDYKKEHDQAPVVQKMDTAIHGLNHAIGFAMTYPLDSDLSRGQGYPSFEQLEGDLMKPLTISPRQINFQLGER